MNPLLADHYLQLLQEERMRELEIRPRGSIKSSPGGSLRRRLGQLLIRLGLWAGGPASTRPELFLPAPDRGGVR
ncbi:MAG: hypothetical protein ACREQM_20870 [Candidatus Dormibacteraceae bacterium]